MAASKPWGQCYRCEGVFLPAHTLVAREQSRGCQALYTLRKEAGSIIATKAGIHAASRFLRHADIQVTSMHYADYKERVTVDMGDLLGGENVAPLPRVATENPAVAHRARAG
jgi:hypothetical protein